MCVFVFVGGVEDKWSNSLITSAATVGVAGEERRRIKLRNGVLVSQPFTEISSVPSSHPLCALTHPPYLPSIPHSFSQIHRQALISVEEEVHGWKLLATLTQLVRLKRVCGLWVRA